ncbi:unnamed protein product [Eruca vesicaria subsp. sativa]|uniref:non-specific serine/threonine protein kinase n=1 Tax=Eruca vesicaria subsp. sativa TaxID=29727 RepID=A0ABC8KS14_ERUVS|nr:unnamed protein product [Eruca vesicaria subsp. sativa]
MVYLSCSILRLVLVLELQVLVVLSQNIINGSVPVGESLTASDSQQFSSSWLCPSGDFALGFRKIQPNDDHGLVLADPRGQRLWSSSLNPSNGSVYQGRMTDAGNFRLLSKDSSNDLWSSFDNPTDTLLPTQSLEVGRNLSSRRTETGFGKGKFRLRLGLDATTQRECPKRFMLKDPNNPYGDCVPSFEMQTCQQENNETNVGANVYELVRLDRVNWPYGDYERYKNYNEESCKAACLNDCFCAAVVFGSDRVCWKKKYPLSYGHSSETISSDTLIKVLKIGQQEKDVPVTTKRGQDRDWLIKLIIACSVFLGTSAFANLMLIALYKKKTKTTKKARDVISAAKSIINPKRVFTYKELEEATEYFKEELGRGAYGIVYKGVLKMIDDSQVTVAVKKLDRVVQEGEKEFNNEVRAIGQTYHKNLVRLIGFCNEGQSRLIVYEYLPRGTLASFLFKRPRPNWKDRRRIAVEIARGILYLHKECCEQIIHCDIKPQNILLDESCSPRISDFGLAKLLRMNQTNTLTNIRGTKGYVATEWFRNSPISSKVDVYSYGVMLLEVVCCKKAVDLEDNVILIDWAYDCFRNRRLDDLIEDDLEAVEDMEMVERYVKIGIWCIQEEPRMRPNMRTVTQMLEGVAQVHEPPNPSPYSIFSCEEYLSCGPVSRV